MNQQCKVCGEPAAGFHFGAFTCEGCKSFFGRSYNNLSAITECKNNSECVINKKNRTACKSCRLRKCLLVGMSKSGSRYGRRSNWFKIHCLLQEQQQATLANYPPSGEKKPPEESYLVPFHPGFFQPEAISPSSMSPSESESSESPIPPGFIHIPFAPLFVRPPRFIIPPHLFPYAPPPMEHEPLRSEKEKLHPPPPPPPPPPHNNNYYMKNNNHATKNSNHDMRNSNRDARNNNHHDMRNNNNVDKNTRRFHLETILGLNNDSEEEEQESPIDLSVRRPGKENLEAKDDDQRYDDDEDNDVDVDER